MSITMYSASSPRLANALKNLSECLSKAEANATARKIDPAVFLTSRLAPDMFALTRQVQIACDVAKGGVARLAGVEVPKHEDTEQSFADLQQRIAKVIAFIESIPAEQINGTEERSISLKIAGVETTFRGLQYLMGFVWPNVHFHTAMTYAILRHNGVDLGKKDFLGSI